MAMILDLGSCIRISEQGNACLLQAGHIPSLSAASNLPERFAFG